MYGYAALLPDNEPRQKTSANSRKDGDRVPSHPTADRSTQLSLRNSSTRARALVVSGRRWPSAGWLQVLHGSSCHAFLLGTSIHAKGRFYLDGMVSSACSSRCANLTYLTGMHMHACILHTGAALPTVSIKTACIPICMLQIRRPWPGY